MQVKMGGAGAGASLRCCPDVAGGLGGGIGRFRELEGKGGGVEGVCPPSG